MYIIIIMMVFFVGCQNPGIFEEEQPYISGRVFNAENEQPIYGASVSTEPVTSVVTTDKDGRYKIPNVKPGTYKVVAEKLGFKATMITINVYDKPVFADIGLQPLKPSILVSPTSLDFGADQVEKTVTIKNMGSGTLEWQGSKTASWLILSPVSGQVSSGVSTIVKITVRRDGLQPGSYSDLVKITSNGGDVDITVQMSVRNPSQPQLYVYPKQIEFGVGENEKKLTMKNTGSGGSIKWSAVTDVNWLKLSKTAGDFTTEDSIKVTAVRDNLPDGVYFGKILLSSNAGSDEVSVTLRVQSQNPMLSVSPSSLDFGGDQFEKVLTLMNIGNGGTISWYATTNVNWLALSRTSGQFQRSDTLKVIALRSNLPAGQSYGQVYITSNAGSVTVGVYIFSGNPVLWVSTDYLDFDSTKSILFFEIRNYGTGMLSWSISATHDWINVSPKSGSGNSTIAVSVDRSKIPTPGVYTGGLLISSNGGSNSVTIRVVKVNQGSSMEFLNKELEIAVLSISKFGRRIDVEISFKNRTKPDSGGQNIRIYVNPNNSYLTDENSWKWVLKGDDLGFTKHQDWWFRVMINPEAKIMSKFYFEPAPNSPDTGREFQLVLAVVYRFDGYYYPDNTIVVVFRNLKIN